MYGIAAVGDRRRRRRDEFLLQLVMALILVALPNPAAPQASPYVPTLDSAYRDLDDLIRAGLVKGGDPGAAPLFTDGFRQGNLGGPGGLAENRPYCGEAFCGIVGTSGASFRS